METNTTIEPYALQYYIAKYGTVENLTKDYIGAIDGLRLQYRQYETNPRKGGRYRREKMEHLRQQAEAIYHELLRVSRAMKDYFAATPTETPQISTQTAVTVNVSEGGEKEAETKENNQIQLIMELEINNLKDVSNINMQDFAENRIGAISILGVDMSVYHGKLLLSRKIQNKALREFACTRNILETAYWLYSYEYASIPGAFINDTFRSSLSDNDKVILLSVYLLSRIAEQLK